MQRKVLMFSYEEFSNYYKEKKYLPLGIYTSKHVLNDAQLKSKYEKYLQSEDKKNKRLLKQCEKAYEKKKALAESPVIDGIWIEVRTYVLNRDNHSCRLLKVLSNYEYEQINDCLYGKMGNLDIAHVMSRGSHPSLKYNPLNLVSMSRYFHTLIDQYIDPIWKTPITAEERNNWWIRIIGLETFNLLQKIH